MGFLDKVKSNKLVKQSLANAEEKVITQFYNAGSITLNLLLSGKVNGGVPKGRVSMIAAPRAHMKTIIAQIAAADFQRKNPNGIVFWIDSEFAFDNNAVKTFGLKTNKENFVLIQDNSIENIQSMVINTFIDYDKKTDPPIFIVLDSIGTVVTSKTTEDSLAGKDTVDMTIAKKKNMLARVLLGISGKNDITVVIINHVYESLSLFGGQSIASGSGIQYAASNILQITSRAKVKDGTDILGYSLTGISAKGRLAKENSKLKFLNTYSEGINPVYGLLEDALEGGYIEKPSNGWYLRTCIPDDKKHRESQIYTKEYWLEIFKNSDFKDYLESKYSYSSKLNEDKAYNTASIFDENEENKGEINDESTDTDS